MLFYGVTVNCSNNRLLIAFKEKRKRLKECGKEDEQLANFILVMVKMDRK